MNLLSDRSIVERLVSICARHAALVVLAIVIAMGLAGWFVSARFAMNTDSAQLIDAKVDWRVRQARMDAAFPSRTNLILVVVDGKTPELAEAATAKLTGKLAANAKLFPNVRRPDGGPFFDQNGLLFLSEGEVRDTVGQLIKAQPFLGALASDPSLRGIMNSLSTMLLGVSAGEVTLADLDKPMAALTPVFESAMAGRTDYLSWRTLVTGSAPRAEEMRRFIMVQPRLDYAALQPGQAASEAIRAAARALNLDPAHGVTVRLTGDIPMADEEFGTLQDGVEVMTAAMLLGVLLTLWLALKSFRIIGAILLTVAAGLVGTMAIGLLAVDEFNIISIAFIALFVGLGVDFGIQFAVRYRSERHHCKGEHALERALSRTGRALGVPLALASGATAVGFFSFLPTSYTGVAELGLVAGMGMIVAFLLSITFLPALMKLMRLEDEAEDVGFAALAPVDDFLMRHRAAIIRTAGAAGAVCIVLTLFVRFDADPLNLRSPDVESVATLRELMANPITSPNTIDIPAASLAEANAVAARVSKLPEVAQAITLTSFVPEAQDKKLPLIQDANNLMGMTLTPFDVAAPPGDAQNVAALSATAAKLREAAGTQNNQAANHARALAGALERLAKADRAARARAEEALVPGLKTMLTQVVNSLMAQPVTAENMPADIRADWVSANGAARVQVSPRNTSSDSDNIAAFSGAVRAVAPDATGAPISIHESGRTIVTAFAEAGILSFIVITLLLAITLRRVFDVAMTLAPLVLAGLLTLGTTVLLGQKLNFANVIALPLLLGIGVAFNIYFVVAWRAGATNLLQSSLTRAVIFSAATTATGFGTLWLSAHPGTASMGELLIISLFWTLVTTLFLSPALLGPPPAKKQQIRTPLVENG